MARDLMLTAYCLMHQFSLNADCLQSAFLRHICIPRIRLNSARPELHAARTQMSTPKTEFCIPTIQPDLAHGLWLMLAALCTQSPLLIVLSPHFKCISAYPELVLIQLTPNCVHTELRCAHPGLNSVYPEFSVAVNKKSRCITIMIRRRRRRRRRRRCN